MSDTEATRLAHEYLRLGGLRKSVVDDNLVNSRLWQDEPADARQYWDRAIAPLPAERRRQVELQLPSINDDA